MLRRPCVECHEGAEARERAGWPSVAACQKCHTAETAVTPRMKAVAAWTASDKPYPQNGVYRTRDFVFFSHARHRAGRIQCESCHGAVQSQEPLRRHRDVTMQACVECHKERQASLDCNACHELGQ